MIDISVVVPVYNTKPEYLKECIESILNQSLRSVELVLVSDGAKDSLISLMESYLDDERVSLYKQENQGVSVARNLGIQNAKGRYITFVDSDDYIDEKTCEIIKYRFEKANLDVLLFGSYKFDEKSCEKYMPYNQDVELFSREQKKLLMLKTMSGTLPIYEDNATKFGSGSACSKLYKKEFLVNHCLLFPKGIKRAEDVNFHIRVFDKADRIGYLNQNLYYYRQNPQSATYQYRPGGIKVFTDALNCLWEFIKEKDEDFQEVFFMRCMYFLLESMDMDYLNKENEKSFSVRSMELKAVMKDEPYRMAIKSMSGRYLSTLKKIPYYLIKHNCSVMLMIFYRIYNMI